MKYLSKEKEKSNNKLKKEYPLLSDIVDIRYRDKDWQELEVCDITGKKIIMTASQYEHNLMLNLEELMVPINELKAEEDEAYIYNYLYDIPCGVYGD